MEMNSTPFASDREGKGAVNPSCFAAPESVKPE
jgi:hypothetical protein